MNKIKKSEKILPINWTDGVKLSKDHFIHQQAQIDQSQTDFAKTQLTAYNYGLLESNRTESDSCVLQIDATNDQKVQVQLDYCHAITQGGIPVYYDKKLYGSNKAVASLDTDGIDITQSVELYLVLAVDPFQRIPSGEPDPDCIPLHHPYTVSKVNIHILSSQEIDKDFLVNNYLTVGRVFWQNNSFVVDDQYIPPTSKILYNKTLLAFYDSVSKILVDLKSYSLIINTKNEGKYDKNRLAKNTFMLCRKVLDFVGQNLFAYQQMGKEQAPIFLVNSLSVLAHYMATELALFNKKNKEELLQYFYEWINVSPSVLEGALNDIIHLEYNHKDIKSSVEKLDFFLAIMHKLWKKLSELEYIGQRRENIVIGEEKHSSFSKEQKKTYSILD
ncbi:MAG: hypothetical protein N4A45_00555 [Flavobacteriales bacterium]|nr:hypothetical protein [Flavobacteriales bacterium]